MKRLALVVCAFVACSKPPPEGDGTSSAPSAHADETAHDALPKKVRLTPAVVRDAKIASLPVTKEVLATTLGLAGEIVADPDRSAKVSSPVAGHLEDIRFKEGGTVKKGDLLATLRVPDLGRLRGTYAATAAKAQTARANAARQKRRRSKRWRSPTKSCRRPTKS